MKGAKIRWTEGSFKLFKHTLRKLTGRSNGISLESRIYRLNTYIRKWMNIKWFDDLGLVSVKTQWCKAQGYI
ncbi:MAG: hypothetical protein HQK83_08835 [Fibrobacteria bacterium]|nr:hypothetical protein [Fibrobacteria bacterium]